MAKRQVEAFPAGCPVCEPTVKLVEELACSNCEVTVYNLLKEGAEKVEEYGIKTVPAVVVDGRLAACCETRGPEEDSFWQRGLGHRLHLLSLLRRTKRSAGRYAATMRQGVA